MVDAYEHGVMCDGDWRRAMRCEVLDELEEFYLLMRHYSLLVGVASSLSRGVGCIDVGDDDGDRRESLALACDDDGGSKVGIRLCSVGLESPMGFRDGQCVQ
ncbi:hypothetical protein ACHAW5_007093 [Stephanodiscus triporus]|uniref:Uncharacterized protein n=1 Tax=Stephanodiscus triporus TaxID=2934178 RepID=A0ABD3R2D8_9STRA